MNTLRILAHVAALAAAVSAGWLARGTTPSAAAVEPAVLRPVAVAAPNQSCQPPSQPLIAVSSDGRATLRVEQQPLEWVLDQIALQTGDRDLPERMRPVRAPLPASGGAAAALATTAPDEPVCADTPMVAAVDMRRLLGDIERGSETERFDGLLSAASSSITIPDALLKSMLETDGSDRVRLLAFERYLEPRSGDPTALRTALEAALYVPNAAVQQEARHRLDELIERGRPDPSDPQQAAP